MSRELPPTVEVDIDDLPAYLDGELDDDARRQVERRLIEDPQWRQRLWQLEQTWDLLDELPRSGANQTFVASTITLVTDALNRETRMARWWERPARYAAALAAASLMALALTRAWLDRPNRQFLEDLPVIENVDVYTYVDSIDFLRQLDQEGLFADEVDDAP